MPGRWSVIFILVFFVGMFSLQWLRNTAIHNSEGPLLKPALELAAQDGTTEWKLYANGMPLGQAVSQVARTQAGIYTLKQRVILNGDLEAFMGPLASFAVKRFDVPLKNLNIIFGTDMELTYLGTMRSLQLNFITRSQPSATAAAPRKELLSRDEPERRDESPSLLHLQLKGYVEGEYMNFHGFISLGGMKVNIDEYKMKHRSRDTFLSTMAPTDCLPGIRLGQRWQSAVIDPTEMLTGALAQSKAKELGSNVLDADEYIKKRITEVRVLEELKELEWHDLKVPCYVVQSQDRSTKMQVWVSASTSRVLRQLVEWPGHSMELIREPKKDD